MCTLITEEGEGLLQIPKTKRLEERKGLKEKAIVTGERRKKEGIGEREDRNENFWKVRENRSNIDRHRKNSDRGFFKER